TWKAKKNPSEPSAPGPTARAPKRNVAPASTQSRKTTKKLAPKLNAAAGHPSGANAAALSLPLRTQAAQRSGRPKARPAVRQLSERRRQVVALKDEDGEEELEAEAEPDRPPVERAAVRGEGDGEAEDEREPEQPAQEGDDVHRGGGADARRGGEDVRR